MKIIVAETAGFCMGVKRAVDLALEYSSRSSNGVYTLGPLIHNQQTIEMLRERHVVTLDKPDQMGENATILIRAHGVPPAVQNEWASKGCMVDGTCPKVKTVHRVIEKYRNMGYTIVITGDEGHAEVIGLQGYAGNAGYLIDKPDDVDALPDVNKICLVSQTTFDNTIFDKVEQRLRERFDNKEIVVKKTICSATDKRQNETRELAKTVDAMIVVGGKNSANTMRLTKIAEQCGTITQWVETEDEIDWNKIANCKVVGITAGASTPNWMIKRIADYLLFMDQTKKKTPSNVLRYFADIVSTLNIVVSTGAAIVYYAACVLQGFAPSVTGAAIAFLYFLSMYLWNGLTSIEGTQHLDIGRYRFYRDHRITLYVVGTACIALLLGISSLQNKAFFYLMIFATFVGCVYHITIIPKFLKILFRFTRLKDVPASRDLFVALAWGIVLTFLPHASAGTLLIKPETICCFVIIFILAFMRSVIFDLRDIEGDRIMGRETLVTFIGEPNARSVIIGSTLLGCLLCALSPFFIAHVNMSICNIKFIFQIIPLLYMYVFVRANRDHRVSRSRYFNILADGQFFITGCAAWLAALL